MPVKHFFENSQANESVSKFKLLSAYGGPGSIVHTPYGSVIVSCIEEWGFLRKVLKLRDDAIQINTPNIREYVVNHAKLEANGSIGISNDSRLLESLKERKNLSQLEYLVLIPDIELNDFSNKIQHGKSSLAINSSFMPKFFADKSHYYKSYKEWYNDWIRADRRPNEREHDSSRRFFPPKCKKDNNYVESLIQDNIVLICEQGHISDFPWSKYLRWKTDNPAFNGLNLPIDLFNPNSPMCCGTIDNNTARIKINSSTANASGFDGKWLKCENCGRQTSLKGLMSVKIKCPGHKPWEAITSLQDNLQYYSGRETSRNSLPPSENCTAINTMKVALTTGNNLYFSRILSSIYMPDELFLGDEAIELIRLEQALELAMNQRNFIDAQNINVRINDIRENIENQTQINVATDSLKEVFYRFQEFKALANKRESEINVDEKYLKIKDVTNNISNCKLSQYFSRILRIDNMKITSAQLDFSRVIPIDSDAGEILPKNIFRERTDRVQVYPVVESYGEGIFFAFNDFMIDSFENSSMVMRLKKNLENLESNLDTFSSGAINYGLDNNWQLYLVHTFSHLIMRELEFRCGYPTASLSERIYVSNDTNFRMYGCMIYTAEGAEGSMGGLIAQTSPDNLIKLITNALERARICSSDPLCWESDGQGLFELNFASCFSCSLVSETSCEHRNMYLDRRILVDYEDGFFKDALKN